MFVYHWHNLDVVLQRLGSAKLLELLPNRDSYADCMKMSPFNYRVVVKK
jgi:hypothetical protein